MGEKMVGNPDLMPDWFKKYAGIQRELDKQLLRGLQISGEGLTLDHLQMLVEHRNPFAEPVQLVQTYADNLISKTAKLLSRRFGKKIVVDSLPEWFTEENLEKAAKFNLKLIFLPDEEIGQDRTLCNWVKPQGWFYRQLVVGKIAQDSARLKRGWYLADFTHCADYDYDIQVFPSDPLASIITKLRQEGIIDEIGETPLGSRFAIAPKDEWPLILAKLAKELGLKSEQIRLERAIEFNAIGNLYDKNRGQFNMWEWFADAFEDSSRLYGGHRDWGGLAHVDDRLADSHSVNIAGRPLVSF